MSLHDRSTGMTKNEEQPQGMAAAAQAQAAMAQAAAMLADFTGGASLLMVEWQVIQQMCHQAAAMFADLDAWFADDLEIEHPRRWWQRAPRRDYVEQVFICAHVTEEPERTTEISYGFWAEAFLLGRDGVLRHNSDYFDFDRGRYPRPPLKEGWIGVDDQQYGLLRCLGTYAGEAQVDDRGIEDTEHLLKGFADLASTTRDKLAQRIGRLKQAGATPGTSG